MDIIDPLSIIAEFSIGLAGFTGIIAAVGRYSQNQLELRLFRFSNLLITAFAPGFFAIFSICLIYAGLEAHDSIRVSAFVLLLYLGAWTVFVIRNVPEQSVNRPMNHFMWVFAMANVALQATNSVAPGVNLVGFYLFGLFLLLCQAAIVFSNLAITTMKTPVETA